jgi:hypothetical protein
MDLSGFRDVFVGPADPIYWIVTAYVSIWSLGTNYFFVRHRLRDKLPRWGILAYSGCLFMFSLVALCMGHAIVDFVFRSKIEPAANMFLGIHFTPLPATIYFVAASLAGQLGAWSLRRLNSRPSNAGLVMASLFHFIMPGWGLFLFGYFPASFLAMWIEIILIFLISFLLIGQSHSFSIVVFALIFHLLASLAQPLLIRRLRNA